MKNLVFILFSWTLFAGFHLPAHAQDALPHSLPRLKVVGNHFETVEGKTVTLRGVSLCSLEWNNALKQIRDLTTGPDNWNVNVIRLPVQSIEWRRVGKDAYVKHYLDPAVKACKDSGVYCIIDWHVIHDWKEKESVDQLKEFWETVAPRYAAEKHILYEFFNEPTTPKDRTMENWLAWRDEAQKWVDQIRKDAPLSIILVANPHWDQMPGFAAEKPFRGSGLAYVLHVYPIWKEPLWDDLFGKAAESVPIFITEWGWSDEKDAWWGLKGNQKDFGDPLRAYIDKRPGISWTAWSYDDRCGPSMLGKDKDMGAFVKQWLKEANP
ncbi:MAG: hypothetical protein DI551_06865 [Micavibrio aeruginosavorus]|uniref:Glycoside hydrolase family 5 domain-containing protein n=1 Tax=Micavibrio aeruginosavorus TaxID=349221 RepID=A0A2W5MXU1_9BACT|nr:MAG: hypothetical protein DI551_06865 [Micavibrio aeruginosavorus]